MTDPIAQLGTPDPDILIQAGPQPGTWSFASRLSAESTVDALTATLQAFIAQTADPATTRQRVLQVLARPAPPPRE